MVMNFCVFQIRSGGAAARLFLAIFIAFAPIAFSQITTTRPKTAPSVARAAETPSAFARPRHAQKPIPRTWKIAIAAAVLITGAVLLAYSARAWRVSNLFGREYRFPPPATVALRLGARRSGGLMAAISFNERAGPARDSRTENL
jgi:hypothetical protein